MAIPDVPEIRELLSELRLCHDKASEQQVAVQIPFLPAVDEAGHTNKRELWLHYTAGTKLPFTRLRDRINKELHTAARHPKHEDFALFALALAALMPPDTGDVISRLNMVLSHVCDADVSLYHILGIDFPEEYNVEIPPFTIGPLRIQKLKYNSDKAGSDFYSRYQGELAKSWAIEREPKKTRVFDFFQIQKEMYGSAINVSNHRRWETQALGMIVDWYFSLHNKVLFEQFLDDLVSAQSVFVALGAPFFDTRSLSMLSGIVKTHRVAIFLNMGARKQGFVAPSGMGPLLVDIAGIHKRIPYVHKELRDTYGVERFDDSPLHRSIKLFADFVARARRHEVDGHINEALLHYVIALELVFGERQAIQKSVSERVAVITFRENCRTFPQQLAFIDGIYDARSKYVHKGMAVTDEPQLDQIRRLCEQTFRCLLRLQAAHSSPASRGEEVLTSWLKELDYVVAGMAAGRQPSETQLSEAFVALR